MVAYFENLLPKGDLRHHLELRHHTTTVFRLLKAIRGDTAGVCTSSISASWPAPSLIKYESGGGPGLVHCRELLQEAGAPAKDLQRLIGWLFFNLLIGNNDSHAKNLAILYTDEGPRLTPFYDLMSTTLYSGLSRRFALRINGEDRPGSIGRSHLEALARALRFQPRYFLRQGLELAERMPAAIDSTLDTLSPIAYQGTEQTLLERLRQRLLSNCLKLPERWSAK